MTAIGLKLKNDDLFGRRFSYLVSQIRIAYCDNLTSSNTLDTYMQINAISRLVDEHDTRLWCILEIKWAPRR